MVLLTRLSEVWTNETEYEAAWVSSRKSHLGEAPIRRGDRKTVFIIAITIIIVKRRCTSRIISGWSDASDSHRAEDLVCPLNFSLNVALTLIDQSFEDDWHIFADFGHDRAERRDRVGGEGIVSTGRVDLAHVDFREPTPKCVQE